MKQSLFPSPGYSARGEARLSQGRLLGRLPELLGRASHEARPLPTSSHGRHSVSLGNWEFTDFSLSEACSYLKQNLLPSPIFQSIKLAKIHIDVSNPKLGKGLC